MALSYAAAEALFVEGRFQELLRQGEWTGVEAARSHSPEMRALLGNVLICAGSLEAAKQLMLPNLSPSVPPGVRSRSEQVLGLVARREGDLEASVRHFQHGVRLGQEAADVKQTAWNQLHLFRTLTEGHSTEELGGLFSETRKLVTRTGDPHLIAFLHEAVALREAQGGRLNEAERHIKIGLSLLEGRPNAWLKQLLHMSSACIASLRCDFKKASSESDLARRLGQITGEDYQGPTIDLNDAHFELMMGHFESCLSKLNRLLKNRSVVIKLAALDCLGRLHLALNRLDDCERVFAQIAQLRSGRALESYYTLRWAAVCRTRLLNRQGLWQQSIDETSLEIDRATTLADDPLRAALLLVQAEARTGAGQRRTASKRLLDAAELGALSIRELQGQYFYTAAGILERTAAPLADRLRARARRVWECDGNLWAQFACMGEGGQEYQVKNYSQRALSDIFPDRDPVDVGSVVPPTNLLLNTLASAFDLSFSADLVCHELANAANLVGCTASVDSGRSSRTAQAGRDDLTVDLESENEPRKIRYELFDDPLKNLAVGDLVRITRALNAVAKANREERNRAALWPAADSDEGDLFASEEMNALVKIARRVAPTNVPVLITGETGTGKEILARAIHAASTRASAIFLPFNCSGGPRDMIDAQLFGHRRGAFTGAVDHASGVIRAAAGGTLFLDEIGDAPPEVQPKLLRFLESGEIHPIGEPKPVQADARVIAATNVDLDAAVSSGRFREDLFYRLNIVRLHLPPLRERRVEIPVFAHHYLLRHARELGKGHLRLAEETMEYLLLYRWPGNVRQLANEMRRLAALAETDAVLMPEHLSPDIVASRRTVPASERTLDANEVVVRLDQPLAAATEHLERAMLLYALKQCRGRMEDTARQLGLSRKGLYLKRVRFGLEPPAAQPRTA